MTTADTPNFGLSRVGQGEDLSKGGYKALDKDRLTLDAILKALATHSHEGESALAPPELKPVTAVASSGGTLPAGTTYHYSVGYVDRFGLETAVSPAVEVKTTDAIGAPSAILLTPASAGTLTGGLYSYAVTYVETTGGETLASPTYSTTITGLAGQSAVFIDMPDKPEASLVFRIYRSRPGQNQLYYLTTTSATTFTDTGSITEDATRFTPNSNTTKAFQKITVTIPGTTAAPGAIPPGVKAWRLYRTETAGTYRGANLVHEVVEPTTQGGADLRVTWEDIRSDLLPGAPQQNNSTIAMPPRLTGEALGAEEATTNLVTNPSFEVDTTSWTENDPSATMTFTRTNTTNAVGGSFAARLLGTATNQDTYIQHQITVAANTLYTVSAYGYLDVYTNPGLGGRGMYITDGTNVSSTKLEGSTDQLDKWYRHETSITTGASATTLSIRLYGCQGDMYWDSVQAETKPYATAYCDGSLGDGHAWTGTAHASTSTRIYGFTAIPQVIVFDSLSAQNIYARSHLMGGSTTATIAAGAGLGGSPPAPSVSGNDVRGTINMGTGTSTTTGTAVSVTFARAFDASPVVVLQPANALSAPTLHHVATTTTGFTVAFSTALAASQSAGAYSFNYMVVG